ncbi:MULTISPECIES: phosphotransferase family protein [Streptosporangium]|uniref:Aminoglycoside phosphotransferase (APT) family kinase protein n=1 Tax=Streptosporangium brasiliense TaxID=47480 RepID=A0ABT9R181_9ACTN|nr:phosphotransferase [Streptosporangium brasiliense]MDP9862210.1 aminoglycoside phosphotransferase (APT) family kinase protein [Streptosporangium brasiliense]
MTGYRWDDLPAEVHDAIAAECGPIRHTTSLPGGLTAGAAVRLDTIREPVFVKALPADSPSAPLYQRERLVGAVLPEGVPAPRMLWSGHTADWVALAFKHVDTERDVDLSPDSQDVADVIDIVRVLGEQLTPNPAGEVPPVADNVAFLARRADALLAAPPADLQSLPAYRAARAGLDLDRLTGDTLLHADFHEGNLLATTSGVRLIDWGLACQGAAWVETALLIPRLILAGHTPAEAERLAEQVPAWKSAPEPVVTGLAAVWSLFREFVARRGPEPIRASRARAAAAGRAWVEYRTG